MGAIPENFSVQIFQNCSLYFTTEIENLKTTNIFETLNSTIHFSQQIYPIQYTRRHITRLLRSSAFLS